MVKLFLISLVLSLMFIPAFGQVANPQVGGPIVPNIQSTISKYCSNGTCQTPNYTSTKSINDTNHEMFTKYNIIMVIPSELCTTAIKHGVKTGCPPLQNITKYDTSNQHISGYFYSKDGKILERTNPQVKNHWMYYGYSNHTIVCVYCTGNYLTTDLYKTIILEPDSFEFVPKTFTNVNIDRFLFNQTTGNFTKSYLSQNEIISGLTSFHNREVRGCNTATISYSDSLLADTIKYMESNCTVTNFNHTTLQKVPNTPWSWDNPYSSLHYRAVVEQVKTQHPGYCIDGNCSYTTSTKKPGW